MVAYDDVGARSMRARRAPVGEKGINLGEHAHFAGAGRRTLKGEVALRLRRRNRTLMKLGNLDIGKCAAVDDDVIE